MIMYHIILQHIISDIMMYLIYIYILIYIYRYTLQEEQSLCFLKAFQNIRLGRLQIAFSSPFCVAGVGHIYNKIDFKAFDRGPTKLHTRNLGTLETLQLLKLCNFWNPGTFGSLKPWTSGTLGPWSHGTWRPGT